MHCSVAPPPRAARGTGTPVVVGTVQVSAAATVGAALIAVVGSISAVWINARLQAKAQRGQWERDARAQRSQVVTEACLRFDGAATLAVARFQELVQIAATPRLRRAFFGRDWARPFYSQVQALSVDLALPYRTVHLLAPHSVSAAADTVMNELQRFSETISARPTKPVVAENLTAARQRFAEAVTTADLYGPSRKNRFRHRYRL